MSPLVSVIIPAYNAENSIQNSIVSVLEQEYKNFEIIVVDDKSTDNTVSVVSKMQSNIKKIICLKNDCKKGPSGARNTGLKNVKGKYIAFLDADDIWLPNHLEKAVRFLEGHKKIDVVLFNFNVVEYETKRVVNDWFSLRNFTKVLKTEKVDHEYHLICDNLFNALIDESFVHLQSMVLTSKICSGIFFNEDVMRSEDRDFAIRLSFNSRAIFAFNYTVTGVYYRHNNSLTTNSIQNSIMLNRDHIALYKQYIEHYAKDDLIKEKINKHICYNYLELSYSSRQERNYKLATDYLFRSLKYNITFSQLKELLKITAAKLLYDYFKLKINSK